MRYYLLILAFLCFFGQAVYAQQKIHDFYLSNIKEDGSRDWEVEGKEAHLKDDFVDINDMKANYYGPKEKIVITSDKARLDKGKMDVQLNENVNVVNEDGSTLSTDSLLWQQSKNHIATDDWVTTTRQDMQIKAKGLSADTALKKADFEQEVSVTMLDKNTKDVTTIICTGPLEIEYSSGTAVFNNDVVVTHTQGKIFSDKTTLYFNSQEKQIEKIVCEGNVKIVRDDNVTFAKRATYFGAEQRLVLEGRPRLIYFTEDKTQ